MIIIILRGENFVAHLDGLGGTPMCRGAPVAHHWPRRSTSSLNLKFDGRLSHGGECWKIGMSDAAGSSWTALMWDQLWGPTPSARRTTCIQTTRRFSISRATLENSHPCLLKWVGGLQPVHQVGMYGYFQWSGTGGRPEFDSRFWQTFFLACSQLKVAKKCQFRHVCLSVCPSSCNNNSRTADLIIMKFDIWEKSKVKVKLSRYTPWRHLGGEKV
jgi:hypothetical protein